MKTNAEFLKALRKKKASLQRKQRLMCEDLKMWETLTRKIELINIMLSEFGRTQHTNSLRNLLRK